MVKLYFTVFISLFIGLIQFSCISKSTKTEPISPTRVSSETLLEHVKQSLSEIQHQPQLFEKCFSLYPKESKNLRHLIRFSFNSIGKIENVTLIKSESKDIFFKACIHTEALTAKFTTHKPTISYFLTYFLQVERPKEKDFPKDQVEWEYFTRPEFSFEVEENSLTSYLIKNPSMGYNFQIFSQAKLEWEKKNNLIEYKFPINKNQSLLCTLSPKIDIYSETEINRLRRTHFKQGWKPIREEIKHGLFDKVPFIFHSLNMSKNNNEKMDFLTLTNYYLYFDNFYQIQCSFSSVGYLKTILNMVQKIAETFRFDEMNSISTNVYTVRKNGTEVGFNINTNSKLNNGEIEAKSLLKILLNSDENNLHILDVFKKEILDPFGLIDKGYYSRLDNQGVNYKINFFNNKISKTAQLKGIYKGTEFNSEIANQQGVYSFPTFFNELLKFNKEKKDKTDLSMNLFEPSFSHDSYSQIKVKIYEDENKKERAHFRIGYTDFISFFDSNKKLTQYNEKYSNNDNFNYEQIVSNGIVVPPPVYKNTLEFETNFLKTHSEMASRSGGILEINFPGEKKSRTFKNGNCNFADSCVSYEIIDFLDSINTFVIRVQLYEEIEYLILSKNSKIFLGNTPVFNSKKDKFIITSELGLEVFEVLTELENNKTYISSFKKVWQNSPRNIKLDNGKTVEDSYQIFDNIRWISDTEVDLFVEQWFPYINAPNAQIKKVPGKLTLDGDKFLLELK